MAIFFLSINKYSVLAKLRCKDNFFVISVFTRGQVYKRNFCMEISQRYLQQTNDNYKKYNLDNYFLPAIGDCLAGVQIVIIMSYLKCV